MGSVGASSELCGAPSPPGGGGQALVGGQAVLSHARLQEPGSPPWGSPGPAHGGPAPSSTVLTVEPGLGPPQGPETQTAT